MKMLFSRLRAYTGAVLASIALITVASVTNLLLPSFMADIINRGVIGQSIPTILRIGGMMLGVTLVGIAANLISGFFAARVAAGLGQNLRSEIFAKVESFSLAEFNKFGTASLITRTTNDINQLQQFTMMLLRIVVMAPLMAVGGIVLAYLKSPKLSNVIFIAVPVLLIMVVLVATRALPLSKTMQQRVDKVNLVLREKLTGLRVLRAFGTEHYEEERFDAANTDLTQVSIAMNRIFALLMPSLTIILNAATIGIVWLGGLQASYGGIMVGDIMAMVQYLMQILMSFTMVSMIFVMLPRAATSGVRIAEVLDTPLSILDPEKPDELPQSDKGAKLEFRKVSFTYAEAERPALADISFVAQPGQTVAIIGSTGSGKSTLLNLIPRLYDATEGEILLDGVNIRNISLRQLRGRLGVVAQKSVLFRGDIASNLSWGKPDATPQELEKAAEIAQALDFISSKEDGFASPVAQGGSNFSGGQKQRLSISRAVVRRPSIYLFDDSFSALDFATDSRLRAALAKETGGATVIIVAQRVSTIMHADSIIVLDAGRVAGIGTHSQLYKDCAVYREIVSSQLSEEEVGA